MNYTENEIESIKDRAFSRGIAVGVATTMIIILIMLVVILARN